MYHLGIIDKVLKAFGTNGGKQVDDCQILMKFYPFNHSYILKNCHFFPSLRQLFNIWENGGTFFWSGTFSKINPLSDFFSYWQTLISQDSEKISV